MGEIAELMINGDICEGCGCELGEGDGYPRRCEGCGGKSRENPEPRQRKMPLSRQPLSAKQLQKLEWASAKSSMYEGCNWDEAPGQFNRLETLGLVKCVQPHNPAHKAKAVLTDAGRAALKAAKVRS